MEEIQCCINSKTMMIEDMNITSLKLYKCLKVNDKLDSQVLFIFRVHNLEYAGQPGSLTERTTWYNPKCTQQFMDSAWFYNVGGKNDDDDDDEFLRTVNDITSRANIFLYRETDLQFACDLTRLIRSCYRFSGGMLIASSEYSLVFVVDVERTCATNGFIEAKQRMLLVDCGQLIDDADDWDYRSVIMDDGFDHDTEDEEMDCETLEKVEMNADIILEEIKSLITYEELDWSKIGNDYVISKEEEKRGECAICLAPYTGKVRHNPVFTWDKEANACTLVRLGCGHSFHHRCIFKWLERNRSCPLCRAVNSVMVW